jgi:hypothetical protein
MLIPAPATRIFIKIRVTYVIIVDIFKAGVKILEYSLGYFFLMKIMLLNLKN